MRRFMTKATGKTMQLFLASVAVVTLSATMTATADAAPKVGASRGHLVSHDHSRGHLVSHDHSRPYHETHGTKFRGGYYYKGREHNHWTYRYWWGKYGCYTYWCPSTSCWYYYYPREERYYPVSYIATATPVATPTPVDVSKKVTQIVNVTNNSPGSATAGKGAVGSAGAPLPSAAIGAPMPPAPPGS